MVELFLKKLSGKRLLDLGSGPGRDAIFFRERGLEPVCVDISPAMVKLCRQNRLIAYQMDIEDLRFTDKSFTGAWAYTSLVHIPKARIHNTLARISELLKPRGLFYAGMIEGKGEILYQSPRLPHKRRFYALYTNREFRKILSDYFDVIAYKRIVTPKGEVYLNYLCQKPEHEFVYPTLH